MHRLLQSATVFQVQNTDWYSMSYGFQVTKWDVLILSYCSIYLFKIAKRGTTTTSTYINFWYINLYTAERKVIFVYLVSSVCIICRHIHSVLFHLLSVLEHFLWRASTTKGQKRISEEAHRYRVCSVFWTPLTNITFYKPSTYEKQLLSLFIWMHADSMESFKHFCQLTTSTEWKHCPNASAITLFDRTVKGLPTWSWRKDVCVTKTKATPAFPVCPYYWQPQQSANAVACLHPV